MGSHAKALVLALAVVAAGNVLFQFYTSHNSALSRWKGGGFGMYVMPHADSRSVWVEFSNDGQSSSLRLWPETDLMEEWRTSVSLRGGHSLGGISAKANRLRYYPTETKAQAILAHVARIKWLKDLRGDVAPSNGKNFTLDELRLVVLENRFDRVKQEIACVEVFTTGKGQ